MDIKDGVVAFAETCHEVDEIKRLRLREFDQSPE
jgi:hypothetical protein